MVISTIFFILRDMNDEAKLVRAYSEIEYKIEALNVLITRFPSLEDASRTRQIKAIRESLVNLLELLAEIDTDKESHLGQMRIDSHDLVYTLDEITLIPPGPLDNMSAELYNILVSQLLMMNQFISDNAHEMAEISRVQINAAQQKAGILILALIVVLVLINVFISFFSGRGILRFQEGLRESENRFRLATDAAEMGIFVRDFQTGEYYWSPEFLAIYGYGPNDQFPLKDGIPTAVHPEDLQDIIAARDRFYRSPTSEFSSEHRIILPDGQVRWVMIRGRNEFDTKGQPLRTHGLAMDITERKHAEEELARTLAKAEEGDRTLDALMEHVPEGITIADAPDVQIRRVSRYGVELTGKTKEVLTGIAVDQHAGKWDLYEADGVTLASDENMPLTRATKYGEFVKDKPVFDSNRHKIASRSA
jgi:PAS domain S-box-containing protein